MDNGETGFVNGALTVLQHEGAGDFFGRMAARHGIPIETIADIIEEVQEFAPITRANGHTGVVSNGLSVVKRGLRVVIETSKDNKELGEKLWYFVFAMGWYDCVGEIDSCTVLARKLKLTKANINKFANNFRDFLPDRRGSLPDKPGQRKNGARTTFAKVRMKQMHEQSIAVEKKRMLKNG